MQRGVNKDRKLLAHGGAEQGIKAPRRGLLPLDEDASQVPWLCGKLRKEESYWRDARSWEYNQKEGILSKEGFRGTTTAVPPLRRIRCPSLGGITLHYTPQCFQDTAVVFVQWREGMEGLGLGLEGRLREALARGLCVYIHGAQVCPRLVLSGHISGGW